MSASVQTVTMETVAKPGQIEWMDELVGMIETHAYGKDE